MIEQHYLPHEYEQMNETLHPEYKGGTPNAKFERWLLVGSNACGLQTSNLTPSSEEGSLGNELSLIPSLSLLEGMKTRTQEGTRRRSIL